METLSDKLSAGLVIGDQQVTIAELKKKIQDKYNALEERNLSTPEDLPDFKYVRDSMWALEWVLTLL